MRMDDTTSPVTTSTVWITVKEAATQLRVSKMTIYRLLHDGSIPAIHLRRSFRIKRSDLNNYIKNSRMDTGT